MHDNNSFDHLSDDWWNLDGTMKGLHAMNQPRIEYINSHIDLEGTLALDVGCGGGILTERLAQAKALVTGIDISSPLIDCAKNHAENNNLSIDYQNISIELLEPKYKEYFNLVTCMELLEHVPDPGLILKHCYKVLKQDGILVISTLNRTIKSYLLGIIAAEYILDIVPKGTHEHQKFIKPSEMTNMLKKYGFTTLCIKGIGYNPLTNNSFLTTDVSVNYILAAKK